MVNLTNPTSSISGMYLKQFNSVIRDRGGELATGNKIARGKDFIIGHNLRSNSNYLHSVNKVVSYNTKLLNSASVTLENIRNKLASLKSVIVQAGGASAEIRELLNDVYKSQIYNINRQLEQTSFCGKRLFDGSSADRSGAKDYEMIPAHAAPLAIDFGGGDSMKVSIPRLLQGSGDEVDELVPSRFMPLFPIDSTSMTALAVSKHSVF